MKKLAKIFAAFVLTFAITALVACAPSSTEKAKAKLEKAGYGAVAATFKEATEEGAIATVTATSKDSILGALGNATVFTLYESASAAKKAYNETKNAEGKTSCVLIGKWVAVGSEEVIKAFKK